MITTEEKNIPFRDNKFKQYNKVFFFEAGMHILKLSKRHKSPISLALIDIDNLAKINEQYDHTIANEIIVKIGETIQKKCRDSDLLAYLGNGRFGLLLYDISGINTSLVLNTIRQEIEYKMNKLKDDTFNITVSIGASVIQFQTIDNSTLEKIYDNTFLVTNKAKEQGKNCVVMY
jgi:diguanylate cyclase (GGDEF)-like protein